MWELIKITMINSVIGSVGASTFLFTYYFCKMKGWL